MMEGIDGLSPRQREILAFVAQGLANKEIALRLDPPISTETVKVHLKAIFARLGASNRAEAAAIWERRGRGGN